MSKATELTPAQWEQVYAIRSEYLAAGLCTDSADRPAAEAAITEMYRLIGKPVPQFVWTDSPATASLAIWLLSGMAGKKLRGSLRGSLGDSLGDSLRGSLGDSLRGSLGDSLWGSLLDSLRGSLGDSLWGSLRGSLLDSLRGSLGDSLRGSLGDSLRGFFDGQQEYWLAFYDAPRRLGIVTYSEDDNRKLDLWCSLAKSCGWWWPYEQICVISERPAAVHVESWDAHRGTVRLHRAGGPAMLFRDGWPVHAWHGRRVPAWVVEEPTPEKIAAEANAEVRRCAIEAYGWDRFVEAAGLVPVGAQPGSRKRSTELAAARVTDPGNPGQHLVLYDVPEKLWGSPVRLLICTNGSAERDGTRRRYGVTVPATVKDALEAAAWTAGLSRDEYARMVRRT